MASHVRWGRFFQIAGIAILALIFCLFAFVRTQQYVLRWRAEKLLADIRQIQVGKTSWTETEELMNRWAGSSTFPAQCTPNHCQVEIQIKDGLWALHSDCGDPCPFLNPLQTPYEWLGGRTAMVEGKMEIANGKPIEASFTMFIEVPEGRSQEYPAQHGLFGIASEVYDFDPYNFQAQRLLHPEYWIGRPGGCEGCVKLMTSFTPLAGMDKIRELTDFDFSCITRWRSCASQRELMPSAWREFDAETAGDEERKREFEECHVPLEFFGQQYPNIVIGDLISTAALKKGRLDEITLRILQILKGKTDWPLLAAENAIAIDRVGWTRDPEIGAMVPGRRYILLGSFATDSLGQKVLGLEKCGLVPFNKQNLAAIERGIATSKVRDLAREQLLTPYN